MEAETVAKVDGRTRRRKGRTEQMLFRVTPERRGQIERLAEAYGLTYVDLVEKAVDVLEALGPEEAGRLLAEKSRRHSR
jgi:hypothetical protein